MPTVAKKLPLAIEDIAATTLRGDLRDFLMQWGQNLQKPWPKMSQREQETFRDAADRQAETLVRRVTQLVGSQGFTSFEISVGDFQKKGTRLEAKIGAPYSRETLVDLAEAGEAGPIVLSLVSMKAFQGERAPAKVMPDQPDLMDDDGAFAEAGEVNAQGEQGEHGLQAGEAVDPETGEIINVPPEDCQLQGEQRLLTDEGGERQQGEGEGAGDGTAAGHQKAALGGDEGGQAQEALTPDQRTNVERLEGIRELQPGEGEAIREAKGDQSGAEEQVASAGAKPKRRVRRSAEQRVADNARATEAGRVL